MSEASLKLALMKALRAERERQHPRVSQEELASRLGWERKTIHRIEVGERSVTVQELPAICRALGVTLDRLLIDAELEDRRALGLS